MAEPAHGPILLKLGGSLITDKGARERARADVLARIAAELAACREAWSRRGLIVGHGSGSYGHFAAAGTLLATRERSASSAAGLPAAAARTQDAAARLHRLVVAALLEAGLGPYSAAPSGWLTVRAGRAASLHLEPLEGALELEMVPVIYGDVVVDRELGMSIASTEDVFHMLVDALAKRGRRPHRAVWLGETDGILDASGQTIVTVTPGNLEAVRAATGGSAGVDVTGGMRLRLETAWRLAVAGVPSWIGDGRRPGVLAAALAGAPAGGTAVLATPSGEE